MNKNIRRLLACLPDHVEWVYTEDVHSVFWEEAGGEGVYYYMTNLSLQYLQYKYIPNLVQISVQNPLKWPFAAHYAFQQRNDNLPR